MDIWENEGGSLFKEGSEPKKVSGVTRLTVVDWRQEGLGRVFEAYEVDVRACYQDDGRTLKVFVLDKEDS